MADVQPLKALHYDLARAGALEDLISPPYDVIDPDQRAGLAARSQYNVVGIDLPEAPEGGDRYTTAATLLDDWKAQGALVADETPAIWALRQEYTDPEGAEQVRHGFFARVRVEDYGPGKVRPHERTHPGPKEDRLRLTRATRANLSPIFALYSAAAGKAPGEALVPHMADDGAWGRAKDHEGTLNTLWRIEDPDAIAAVHDAMEDTELLIADGHHRYETARVYAEEIGSGEGDHQYVLMLLVALQDPGLLVFPTHRLVKDLSSGQQEALAAAIRRDFDVEELGSPDDLVPTGDGPVRIGYLDSHHKQPFMLTLKDQGIADAALEGKPEPYRRLDTAVLEALLLKGALGMTEDDISHLNGLGYSRTFEEARDSVESGAYDAGFFMRATPVEEVAAVAEAGENMPPKSTFFYPKVPTGLLFNPLG
jgi:uncharacterized protein (DUF1015 family)